MSTAAPEYTVLIGQTTTGVVVGSVPFSAFSFTDTLDWASPGIASITVPLTGKDAPSQDQMQLLQSIRLAGPAFTAIIVREQRPLWAGLIWTLQASAGTGGTATIAATNLPQVFDGRVAIQDPYQADPSTAPVWSLTLSPHDLVIALLTMATTGDHRGLPITFPAMDNRGGPTTIYTPTDLGMIFDQVTQVVHAGSQAPNPTGGSTVTNITRESEQLLAQLGPDVFFTPTLAADASTFGWTVQVGDPIIGSAASVATADVDGGVMQIDIDLDFSQIVTTGYVPGTGTSSTANVTGTTDTVVAGSSPGPIGVSSIPPPDQYPPGLAFERVDLTTVSITDQSQLNGLAGSYVEAYQGPVETWTVTLQNTMPPFYGEDFLMGDMMTIQVTDHPLIPDGSYAARVTGISSYTPTTCQYTVTNPTLNTS